MVINMFYAQRLNHAFNLININQFSFSFLLLFSFIASHKAIRMQFVVFTNYFHGGIIFLPLTLHG